jgi:hypothetical protein
MFPAHKEFVSPRDEFGQRTHIRYNFALKGQAVTARPAGEFEDIRIRRIVQSDFRLSVRASERRLPSRLRTPLEKWTLRGL